LAAGGNGAKRSSKWIEEQGTMSEEKEHILVVDDDVQLVDSVKTLLESQGYQVSFAYQAEKGLELARENKPDLILLDIMFAGPPGPDGVEISRQIHQDAELGDVPVIILSGVKKVLDMPVQLGPDEDYMPVAAFLEKPFKPQELLAKIQDVLEEAG
jgi:two-component system alkaline phosphatase synthesis response regulator PhoP